MKNNLLVQKLICMALFAVAIACKKTNTITVQQPTACFTIQVKDASGGYLRNDYVNYIDSIFYFSNCSDSGTNITYQWSFGDGATSNDRKPVHSYTKRGKYTVMLEVHNNNLATDTMKQTVSVISGQQDIGFGEGNNAYPVAINETATGDFILLGSTNYGSGYFLMQLDSLLKQKSLKTLPGSYRLVSMKPTSDGNYIFTGTTSGGTRNNELIKLNPDGVFLWNRTSSASDDTYANVSQTPDGGFVVVGTHAVKDTYGNAIDYGKVKKFDANGSVQWERTLDGEGMRQTKEIVLDQDGFVVAGLKRSASCYDCDSVMIVKLNNAGDLVWKNTVYGGLNNNLNAMRITKYFNGNYAVATEGNRGIFIFSPTGDFLDRKLAKYSITAITTTGDENLIVLQTESGNGFNAAVSKISANGAELWFTRPNGVQKTQTGSMCCSSSWPISVQPLHNGGTLMVSNRVNYTATYSIYEVMTLLPLDDAGRPK
jgi:PKD repeat protein